MECFKLAAERLNEYEMCALTRKKHAKKHRKHKHRKTNERASEGRKDSNNRQPNALCTCTNSWWVPSNLSLRAQSRRNQLYSSAPWFLLFWTVKPWAHSHTKCVIPKKLNRGIVQDATGARNRCFLPARIPEPCKRRGSGEDDIAEVPCLSTKVGCHSTLKPTNCKVD